ncbi:MAG: 30S ribosomal protein S18 [Candidatus Daviesbacteria bacterium]|nr:30S ribosomal protein S18 [Candidatus Daviesbacteria bacterium]MDP3948317.1 30S ribosomal protein S18 [bacterium]
MAEKKITRKVISKVSPKETEETPEQTETDSKVTTDRPKKTCFFCQSKTSPSYTDIVTLRRFTTDRVKIVARAKSNLCSKHQRAVTRQIKYARHLALLPFVPKV